VLSEGASVPDATPATVDHVDAEDSGSGVKRRRVIKMGRLTTLASLVAPALPGESQTLNKKFIAVVTHEATEYPKLLDAIWKLGRDAASPNAPATVRALPWTHRDFCSALARNWFFCREKGMYFSFLFKCGNVNPFSSSLFLFRQP
jgi:hypothetical protein